MDFFFQFKEEITNAMKEQITKLVQNLSFIFSWLQDFQLSFHDVMDC